MQTAKRILIIGGAGFIGSNSAVHFLKKGFSVVIFDNLSRPGSLKNKEWIESNYPDIRIVSGDITKDLGSLQREIEEADYVLHLAAQVAVTTSLVDPVLDFEVNARGTHNVLEAIRLSKKRPSIIYSSTNKVYGSLEHIPLEESDRRYNFTNGRVGVGEKEQLDFHSPYGCSKGAADQYVIDYGRIFGLKTMVFRQSCIYGYRQFGVEDQGWVAWFLIAALQDKKLSIYGNGKQVRDVLFIDDLVNLYDLGFSGMDQDGNLSAHAFNVGGGYENSISLIEFIDVIAGLNSKKIEYDFAAERPGDQKIFISDNSLVKEKLGWYPRIHMNDGIPLLNEWVRENKHYFLS